VTVTPVCKRTRSSFKSLGPVHEWKLQTSINTILRHTRLHLSYIVTNIDVITKDKCFVYFKIQIFGALENNRLWYLLCCIDNGCVRVRRFACIKHINNNYTLLQTFARDLESSRGKRQSEHHSYKRLHDASVHAVLRWRRQHKLSASISNVRTYRVHTCFTITLTRKRKRQDYGHWALWYTRSRPAARNFVRKILDLL